MPSSVPLNQIKDSEIKQMSLGFIERRISSWTKRAFDIFVAAFSMILLSPIFIFIALLIKRDSQGPVFYKGQRIGRYGRVFKMLKFRTMYEADRSYLGPCITCEEDDRITPLGKWLRDTKLNELPQLWNVLIGEMSLVGPRPEDPSIAKTWPIKIARELLVLRPGITSPASIVYRDEENMLHAGDVMRKYLHELSPDKMRLDLLYARYRSFWLDLDVILWTVLLLTPKIRAYTPPEQLLFVGPIAQFIQHVLSWFMWDFIIVFTSISIAGGLVRLFGPLNMGWLRAAEMALGFSALYALIGIIFGTNRINWKKASPWDSGRLLLNWLLATAVILSIHRYLGFTSLGIYSLLIGSSILSLAGIVFIRYKERFLNSTWNWLSTYRIDSRATRERVIIVGSGRTAEHIAWLLDHPTYSGKFQVVGFIDDDLQLQGMKIYGSKVIGKISDTPRIIRERDIGLVILADFQTGWHNYKEFSELENFKPARVVVAPDIFGSLNGLREAPKSGGMGGDFNDFQCQHCLARYALTKNAVTEVVNLHEHVPFS